MKHRGFFVLTNNDISMKEKQKKEEKYVVKAGLVIISLYQKVISKSYISVYFVVVLISF